MATNGVDLPFEGVAGFAKESAGAESRLISANYTTATVVVSRATVELAAKLDLNHRAACAGSTAIEGFTFSMAKFTNALKKTIFDEMLDLDLMEFLFRADGADFTSPTTESPVIRVQFFLLNGPMVPMAIDEEYVYETGAINAVGLEWDDGATPTIVGTIETT